MLADNGDNDDLCNNSESNIGLQSWQWRQKRLCWRQQRPTNYHSLARGGENGQEVVSYIWSSGPRIQQCGSSLRQMMRISWRASCRFSHQFCHWFRRFHHTKMYQHQKLCRNFSQMILGYLVSKNNFVSVIKVAIIESWWDLFYLLPYIFRINSVRKIGINDSLLFKLFLSPWKYCKILYILYDSWLFLCWNKRLFSLELKICESVVMSYLYQATHI